jgi:hypothetical protein
MSNNQQTEKPHVKIERWELVGGAVLFGFALNHPRLGSCMVRTSSIVKVDMQARTVETLNTVYELVGDSAAALRAASKRETISAPYAAQTPAVRDERAAFEADYAKVWNAAMKDNGWLGDYTADDVKALRDGNTYGDGRTYLNARWEGWQARAKAAA